MTKEINTDSEINKLFEKYNIQTNQILGYEQFTLLRNKINTEIAGLFEPTSLTGFLIIVFGIAFTIGLPLLMILKGKKV